MDSSETDFDWQTPEERQMQANQATDLLERASRKGLRFEVYLTPKIAGQVLADVAKQRFRDPSEFVFVAAQMFWELEQFPDLKEELLKRQIQAAMDSDVRIPAGRAFEDLKAKMADWHKEEPATWQKPAKQGL